MMEILATVLGVCFVALVMLSLCRAAAQERTRWRSTTGEVFAMKARERLAGSGQYLRFEAKQAAL